MGQGSQLAWASVCGEEKTGEVYLEFADVALGLRAALHHCAEAAQLCGRCCRGGLAVN